MNRSQLIAELQKEISDLDRNENPDPDMALNIVRRVFTSIKDALDEGDKVELRGFGSFRLKHYESYLGRNPKTGQQVKVKQKIITCYVSILQKLHLAKNKIQSQKFREKIQILNQTK